MPRRVIDIVSVFGLAAIYVMAARLGLALDAVADFATFVWAPTGISLAALLLLGKRVWPGVFIGAAIANALTRASLPVALGIAIGNTLEALLGAHLLRRRPQFRPTLENAGSVIALIVFAALLSTLVSATIGVATLYLGGALATTNILATWRAWWVGDMVGALLIAPPLLVWATQPRVPFRRHWRETLALCVVLLAATITAFFGGLRGIPT